MNKAVFLDLDDTLVETQVLYEQARAQLAAYMQSLGIEPAAAVLPVARMKSAELVERMGYSKARYPQSFENTLRHFRSDPSAEQVRHVRELAATVFTATAKLRPGVLQGLALLRNEFRLFLITAGDAEVQRKRICDLPFMDTFEHVVIVNDKTAQCLADVAAAAGLSPSEVVVIGDSLRADVKPAVEAGMRAVLVASNNWQLHEMVGHELPATANKAKDLKEAAAMLVKEKLVDMLAVAWNRETSADGAGWSASNPAHGQCAVTACVVQDALDGDIVRTEYKTSDGQSGSHYFNVLDDEHKLDLTYQQFLPGTIFEPSLEANTDELVRATSAYLERKGFQGATRDYILSFGPTRERYAILKQRLKAVDARGPE